MALRRKEELPKRKILTSVKTLAAIQAVKGNQEIHHVPITYVGSLLKRFGLGEVLNLNEKEGKRITYYGPNKKIKANIGIKSFLPVEITSLPPKGKYRLVRIYNAA